MTKSWDSKVEKKVADYADSDSEVVCFLKLPPFYNIPTKADGNLIIEGENLEVLKRLLSWNPFNKQDIIDEVLLKNGFMLDYNLSEQRWKRNGLK